MNALRLLEPIGTGALLLTAIIIGGSSPPVAAADTPPEPIVLYRADGTTTDTLRWATSKGEQNVLEAVGDDEERWLILTAPDGSRTRFGGPRTHPLGNFGHELEFHDETTGWWIRYSLTTPGFTRPELPAGLSFNEAFERLGEALRDSGAQTHGEIWTSDGILVRRSTADGEVLYSDIARELREKGLGEAIPESAQNAARFLVRMLERNPRLDSHWEFEFGFLGLLVDALDPPEGEVRDSTPSAAKEGSDSR